MVVGGDCFVLEIYSILVSMGGEVKDGGGMGIGEGMGGRYTLMAR